MYFDGEAGQKSEVHNVGLLGPDGRMLEEL